MKPKEHGDDKFARFVCSLNLDGLTGTRIILWLLALTLVSFAIGFGLLALSGDFPPPSDRSGSPFRTNAMAAPNVTVIALDGAPEGRVSMTMGAGELTVRGGAPADALAVATVFSRAREWQPDIIPSLLGTTRSVSITDRGHKGKEWFAVHSPNRWEILLNDRAPLDLRVELGAGDGRLDLGSLNLKRFSVHSGAGETRIDLGGYSGMPFSGEVHNGVGDLTLVIPADSNTRITVQQGVGDIKNNGLEQLDEHFITGRYNPSLPANEILVSQGLGDITLEAV